jgi:hypothetical protein
MAMKAKWYQRVRLKIRVVRISNMRSEAETRKTPT